MDHSSLSTAHQSIETPSAHSRNWERQVLEKIALEGLAEQKARRRWGIFFKLLGFAYLLVVLWMLLDWEHSDKLTQGKHTAVVTLQGLIEPGGEASAENLLPALQAAFADKNTAGVVLRVNSPGGSPVQAGMINDEIRRLRTKYSTIPLYVVVEDVCASGCYYAAAAADAIYVDKASVIGSIGVLMNGFGFTGVMDKLGIERRLLTAGENKGMLDPFSPQDHRQKQYAQLLLNEIHKQFIDTVRAGRGTKLKETPEIFSGLIWTGAQSVQLGLADGVGSVESVARDVVKVEKIQDYSLHENIAERFAKRFGAELAERFVMNVGSAKELPTLR